MVWYWPSFRTVNAEVVMQVPRIFTRITVTLGAALGVGSLALVAGSCEDSVSARTAACRKFCTELEECDDRTDQLGCVEGCQSQKFRSDLYFDVRASCAEMSCNQWASEVTDQGIDACSASQCVLIDCIGDQLQKLDLSKSQGELCKGVTTKLLSCDKTLDEDDVAEQCQHFVLSSADDFVEASRSCVDEACADIERCIERLADKYDTDARIFSGTLGL
jgi:hypothetical protein